jgi:hypothetical protein
VPNSRRDAYAEHLGRRGAAEEFTASFFEDVWGRATGSARRGRIICSVVEGLSGAAPLTSAEDLRDAFAARLKNRPWTDDERIGVVDE